MAKEPRLVSKSEPGSGGKDGERVGGREGRGSILEFAMYEQALWRCSGGIVFLYHCRKLVDSQLDVLSPSQRMGRYIEL